QVEAVERVDDVDVRAVRRVGGAVGLGQVHAHARVLVVVVDREAVARERRGRPGREVEERFDRGEGEPGDQDQDGGGDRDDAAIQRTHQAPPSVRTALPGRV